MKTKFVFVFGFLCLTPWMARAVSIYTWQGNSSSLFSCTFQVEDSKLVDGEIGRDDITIVGSHLPEVVTPDANVIIVFKFNSLHLFVDPQGNIVSGSFDLSDFSNIGGVANVFGSANNLTENSYVGGQLVNTYTEDGRWITSHTADEVPDPTARQNRLGEIANGSAPQPERSQKAFQGTVASRLSGGACQCPLSGVGRLHT